VAGGRQGNGGASERGTETSTQILEAARSCLLADGYANLSTRKVADAAGVPLSQIHYHFGGKSGMILALLDYENRMRVQRQRLLYGTEMPLWKRYDQACDFLDDDLESGYVRVLQEMIAAGWSDAEMAGRVVELLRAWLELLEQVATEAEARFGSLGPFTPHDIGVLVGLSFLGGEALILLGDKEWGQRVRLALRRVGDLIRSFEEADTKVTPRRARARAR
jgi:AcrR family transcriptional regulator